ncbi:nicotinamide mononucleotide transporter [Ruminiclostridium herbifermentans]|uniref:Nicotinamide mononucleotide transporter n=1 Tax=Ruminiclostridium herbifermentans TaxID=2488810 RepID=A0A7H1VKG9_9FIRM|nr:nicotinamide mononucleotide transporter [Ruminiclostridium herbifermentans]
MIFIVANTLMVLRFKEQWILWIVVDFITITMWFIDGDMIQVQCGLYI